MEKVVFFIVIFFVMANAEPPSISGTGLNQEQMAENVKKFSEGEKWHDFFLLNCLFFSLQIGDTVDEFGRECFEQRPKWFWSQKLR